MELVEKDNIKLLLVNNIIEKLNASNVLKEKIIKILNKLEDHELVYVWIAVVCVH
ncbi:MAG: hypothetical protein ACOC5T_02505 [Elusimicrobiota bacterium]